MTETWDEVRVIASDAPLKPNDRATLKRAADEFDELSRLYLVLQASLLESLQMRDALKDQIKEIRRKEQPPLKWSYSSGWMPVKLT